MRVVLAAGGRFISFHQAHQLILRNSLLKFFTFSYTKNDESYVPARFVNNQHFCQLLSLVFSKTRLNSLIPSSVLHVIKDTIFDRQMSKKLEQLGSFDLFIGWAHYFLESIPAIRRCGAKIILESGSCHISYQQKLLEEEYKKNRLSYTPILAKNREKILAEYEQADFIITPSKFVRQSFIDQGIAPDKLFKVAYGCSTDFFIKESSVKQQQKTFRVIFAGIVSIQKGIHYLLEAWNSLNLPEDKTELLIVGTINKDMRLLLKNITLKKNIIFYGPTSQENLRSLYQQASLFVLPSVHDGFGMVLSEAMASSLPVIVTTQAGSNELITDSYDGFVVPACNSKALAEKIAWCYHHPKQAFDMGMRGLEKIQQTSWQTYGKEVYQIYEKILGILPHEKDTDYPLSKQI